jgi:SEC-C motif-containing protein
MARHLKLNSSTDNCYCGLAKSFSQCCQPYINAQKQAPSAEALMRSRFSAYATQAFDYVLATYAHAQRAKLDLHQLRQDATHTHWYKLEVLKAEQQENRAQVEFCAYYHISTQGKTLFYRLHELSDFCLEDKLWRYTSGQMSPDSGQIKLQRNEACPCASGKKYKKCCAN